MVEKDIRKIKKNLDKFEEYNKRKMKSVAKKTEEQMKKK